MEVKWVEKGSLKSSYHKKEVPVYSESQVTMNFVKFETFIPATDEQKLVNALDNAGLLRQGKYDSVYASTKITGHWRPLEGANPTIGVVGEVCTQAEIKLEFRVRREDCKKAYEIIKAIHPYEEPVIQAFEMIDLQLIS